MKRVTFKCFEVNKLLVASIALAPKGIETHTTEVEGTSCIKSSESRWSSGW